GFADLLGSADAIVLDEAHQLPDLALEVFGASVSRRQIELLVADTRAEWSRAGLPATAADAALQSIERSLAALAATLPLSAGRQTLATAEPRFAAASSALCEALEGLAALPERFGATDAPAIAKCGERALALSAELRRIAGDDVEPGARSVEQHARGFTLSLLPFDIADRFAALMHARPMAWIFTSATLSVGVDFGHFAARLGLQDAATLRIDSPFDYAAQALLYLPSGLPEPAAPQFGACMLRAIWPLVEAAQGGAFLLFTSHRALAQAAVALRSGEFGAMPGPLLVQGEAPREQLLREFRRHGDAVLLGTASFWEGVDVKGDALRLVVIEKLPFASPDDPLVKARSEYLRQQGRDPFRDYQLPEAALALKQGIGRLIRSEHDRGVIAICDPRLTAKGYGRVFRACLPPMPITREPDEAVRFLRRLRTAA
ncbi:MAG: ATP-dependent DNA helicase, partial [Steroidobacteraceae bacterium]|nr:ATP-dependent DNA helicase [Steroidobacteraceae bacterium]